ncbi:uncharacterized protein LOC125320615 [Corvus hawaiiensis]|uniref:uncharacterized protein LOC125320615 n=1 Tax=Corvus hawaiiensis TaxID=134902 RepID=UPI0020190BB8|nr:uncharacterized protein LOC125320615 [Corvus hawaiiensis]
MSPPRGWHLGGFLGEGTARPSLSQFVPVPPSSSQFAPVRDVAAAAAGARRSGAAPFVIQVASWCSLATNGSFVATNATLGLLLALAQVPLVCADFEGPRDPRAVPCPGGGLLAPLGKLLAHGLNGDPRWGQRLLERRQLCGQLPGRVWPPRSAPPAPSRARLALRPRSGPAAPDVPRLGLHPRRGHPEVVPERGRARGPSGTAPGAAVGDGTFRAQVSIEVAAAAANGDAFECSALHPQPGGARQRPLGSRALLRPGSPGGFGRARSCFWASSSSPSASAATWARPPRQVTRRCQVPPTQEASEDVLAFPSPLSSISRGW